MCQTAEKPWQRCQTSVHAMFDQCQWWRNKCQHAPDPVIFVSREQLLYLHFLLFFCSPGWESHLQKRRHDRGQSKVRGQMMELHSDNTVWNRMRDKRGGFFNALTVCCSHKTLAFCHYFSFTNCLYLLCIFWKCTVCIDVGGLFYFFHVELERMNWRQNGGEKNAFLCPLIEPSSHLCCINDGGKQCRVSGTR